jgi:WD40 repeat protein
LESMRETQDPYLYCSVTSTAFHEDSQKALTGSFDKTVKVWDIASDSSGMTLCGTWHHGGVINFVVTSPHHSKVATAADVIQDAIRVYDLSENDVSNSFFTSYSGSRAEEQSAQQLKSRQTWAYYPATLQWGKAPRVAHLLLAGYSPRSFDVHQDVPDDKKDTGELCLWDTTDGERVVITSARTQNVFEVVWHPTLPIFVAATSATGEHEDRVRTQLRIFSQTEQGAFSHTKTFDCRAMDINEITLMPNSPFHCYLTASCTDGNTYVWDSAQEEKPIHVLRHGHSIDDQILGESNEEVDSGVKFAAWGRTSDRFYTGSSDGIVKAWNVRAPPGEEHVADVISLSGGISAGAFSSDHSRLLMGDATGKLHVLKSGDLDECEDCLPRHRQPIIPHYEASRSTANEDFVELSPEPTAKEMAQKFIDAGQIVIHPDPYVGAVQGENYTDTALFCRSLHKNGDPLLGPLEEAVNQQKKRYQPKSLIIPTAHDVWPCPRLQHEKNYSKDLQPGQLDLQTVIQLEEDGVDFNFNDDNGYEYDADPGDSDWGDNYEDDVVVMVNVSAPSGNGVFLSEFPSYFRPYFALFSATAFGAFPRCSQRFGNGTVV